MSVERIGRAFDLVESEGKADLRAEPREVVMRGLQPAALAEFFLHVLFAVEPALGNRRVELIGPPAHGDGPRILRERRLEAFLAEIAPWTHDVADDVDGQNVVCFAHGLKLRLCCSRLYVALRKPGRKRRDCGLPLIWPCLVDRPRAGGSRAECSRARRLHSLSARCSSYGVAGATGGCPGRAWSSPAVTPRDRSTAQGPEGGPTLKVIVKIRNVGYMIC